MKARLIEADDEYAAVEQLHANGLTDGLPVVTPTPERVQQMILASGMDGDQLLGEVGPANAAATLEKVAINAVMAGCLPDYFPVVVAAVRAACQPMFDLSAQQTTTHSLTPIVIVNGPAREACGIASGVGALGSGFRANAAIGRALRLVMTNIGGATPGVSDMAVLGQAGKFAACFAEAEEESPYVPLSVSRGFEPGASVVTLVSVDAPHSIIASPDGDDPDAAERIVRVIAHSIANAGANNTYGGHGSPLVILNPNHARIMAKRYGTLDALAERLCEVAVTPRRVLTQYAFPWLEPGDADDLVPAIGSPENLIIAVAGGEGVYSAVANSWGGGENGVRPVSQEIQLDQFCELPSNR